MGPTSARAARDARRRARRLASALAMATCIPPARAAAATTPFELEWDAPLECPGTESAEALLAGYLANEGSQEPGSAAEPAEIEVRIEREDDGRFVAEVTVESAAGHGERVFAGNDCRDVTEAAALIAAMLVDPGILARSDAPPSAPEPAATPTDDALRFAVGVHVLGDGGSLPQPTLGGGLSLGLRLRRLHAGVRLCALLPRPTKGGPQESSGGELGLYAASLSASFELARALGDQLAAGPTAGFEAGVVAGRGRGLQVTRSRRAPWVAPALGFMLQLRAEHVGAELRLQALAPLDRPSWVLDDYGELFRAPSVAGRLSLDVTWWLP